MKATLPRTNQIKTFLGILLHLQNPKCYGSYGPILWFLIPPPPSACFSSWLLSIKEWSKFLSQCKPAAGWLPRSSEDAFMIFSASLKVCPWTCFFFLLNICAHHTGKGHRITNLGGGAWNRTKRGAPQKFSGGQVPPNNTPGLGQT